MTRVMLDAELRARLRTDCEQVEFTDESGIVIGHWVPHDRYMAMLDAWLPPITPEERAEAIQEMRDGKCLTTAEVLEGIERAKREWEARQ